MKAILFVLLALGSVLAVGGCTVNEDDPDTTVVKPDNPDIIVTPPAADNKP